MTLPIERANAIENTRLFLYDLLDPKRRPKTVKELRLRVRMCLKHFPSVMDMEDAQRRCPEIFGEYERRRDK